MNIAFGTIYLIVAMALGGIISAVIANARHLRPVAFYAVLGVLFPIVGIIVAAVVRAPGSAAIPAPPVGQWAPDPWHVATWRWWDGQQWTGHTA